MSIITIDCFTGETFSEPAGSVQRMCYQVNIQLRRGERLMRNWFNHGLHVNGILEDGAAPGCLTAKIGEGSMAFLRGLGDLADGRIGSGLHEYEVPLADGSFRAGALAVENLACQQEDGRRPAVHLKDRARPGLLEIEMPSSHVYLNGRITAHAVLGRNARIRFMFSDNNGLDWREAGVQITAHTALMSVVMNISPPILIFRA